MGYGDDGFAFGTEGLHGIENVFFGNRVECRRCLVKNVYLRVFVDGSGNGKTLFFAA